MDNFILQPDSLPEEQKACGYVHRRAEYHDPQIRQAELKAPPHFKRGKQQIPQGIVYDSLSQRLIEDGLNIILISLFRRIRSSQIISECTSASEAFTPLGKQSHAKTGLQRKRQTT